MSNIEDLVKDGFSSELKSSNDLAFVSLKIALTAYYSTYQSMQIYFSWHYDDSELSDADLDDKYPYSYFELYAETIVHFQHFFELLFKQILRNIHALLATDTSNKHDLLFKLLHNAPVTEEEQNKLNSIEFSKALERLTSLIKKELIANHIELQFIKDHHKVFSELNALRNRIWHWGTYILRYKSLDIFIGKHILPLLIEFSKLASFKNLNFTWQYNTPN